MVSAGMNESKYSKISDNREIINIGDVLVNGVSFDFYRGIDNLGYDLRDDWFSILCIMLICVIRHLFLNISQFKKIE